MTPAPSDARNGRGEETGRGPAAQPRTGAEAGQGFAARLCRRLYVFSARLGNLRLWVLAACHALIFALTYWLAFGFRLDFVFMTNENVMTLFRNTLPWIVGLKVVVFYATRQFHGWWRCVTFADLVALARASLLCLVLAAAANYFLLEQQVFPLFSSSGHLPRSVLALDCLLTIMFLGAMRSSWRAFREHFWAAFNPKDFRWALMVGTDHAAGVLAHQITVRRPLAVSDQGPRGHQRRDRQSLRPNPDPRVARPRPPARRNAPRDRTCW